MYQLISRGESEGHWLEWLFKVHLEGRAFTRVLSIGCGVGDHEIAMASLPNVAHIDAFDFSQASIDIAQRRAGAYSNKLTFFTGDFNTIRIPPSRYDLILCSGSLHHVRELEHLLGQVRAGLISTGVFVANEYVGDCYNIYQQDQLGRVNEVLSGLPQEYQAYPGQVVKSGTIEQVFERDPTEAVRSKLIPDFLRFYFRQVDERQFGGALLHPIYPFINVVELAKSPRDHQALMNTLAAMDRQWIRQGKSDFSFFICRP